jgi:hypothetical protein
MYSMWNAPSDRDYYASLDGGSGYPDADDVERCWCCGARWESGDACEEWCETNQAALEPAPDLRVATEEEALTALGGGLEQVRRVGWIALYAVFEAERRG